MENKLLKLFLGVVFTTPIFAQYTGSVASVPSIINANTLNLGGGSGGGVLDILAPSGSIGITLNGTAPTGVSSGAGTAAVALITAIGPVGGATSDSTTNRSGGSGGTITITGGAGGGNSGTFAGGSTNRGGLGGALTISSGSGGNATGASGTTRGGGAATATFKSGAGGTSLTGNGGAGGQLNLTAGNGGITTGAANSGAGGGLSFAAGNGGDNSNAAGTTGVGGDINVDAGAAGTASGGATSNTNGAINIGINNASSITISRTGINTTFNGPVLMADKVTQYNGITTVSNGQPSEIATIDLTSQTASIGATALYTPTATGLFRISYYAKVTSAASVSSILGGTSGLVLAYTDGTDSVAQTAFTMPEDNQAGTALSIGTGNTTNTTQAVTHGSAVIYAKTGVGMTYAFGYTSSGTAMAYELHIKVEAL